MDDLIKDQKNYKKLSKPFATKMDAVAAMQGFLADVLKARQKWRVVEMVTVVGVNIEGETEPIMAMQQMGNTMVAPRLLQLALGTTLTNMLKTVDEILNANAQQPELINETAEKGD